MRCWLFPHHRSVIFVFTLSSPRSLEMDPLFRGNDGNVREWRIILLSQTRTPRAGFAHRGSMDITKIKNISVTTRIFWILPFEGMTEMYGNDELYCHPWPVTFIFLSSSPRKRRSRSVREELFSNGPHPQSLHLLMCKFRSAAWPFHYVLSATGNGGAHYQRH